MWALEVGDWVVCVVVWMSVELDLAGLEESMGEWVVGRLGLESWFWVSGGVLRFNVNIS